MEPTFENLNPYSNLEFLTGNSPEDIKDQLVQLKFPIRIIQMYAAGTKHFVWFQSSEKINKVKKGIKNGNSK